MDKPSDDQHTLGYLAQALGAELEASAAQIDRLHAASRTLVDRRVHADLCGREGPESGVLPAVEDDEAVVALLEHERLDLVMDIQKQDYLCEKICDLNDQNCDIVDSVREFYENKDDTRRDYDAYSHLRLAHFTDDYVQLRLDLLDLNVAGMESQVNRLHGLFGHLEACVAKDAASITSDAFQADLGRVVAALNRLFAGILPENVAPAV